MDNILEQLQGISLTKEEITVALRFCTLAIEEYNSTIQDLETAIDIFYKSKNNSFIYIGTPEEIQENIDNLELAQNTHIKEYKEQIQVLTGFISKMENLIEIL